MDHLRKEFPELENNLSTKWPQKIVEIQERLDASKMHLLSEGE